MGFDKWDSELHQEPEQVKRIISSQKIPKGKILRFEPDDEMCVIQGSSGTYMVSLDRCECFDFSSRKLPCKHIYRLAHELGYLPELPVLNKKLAKAFDVDAEIKRFYDLWQTGVISGEKYIKICEILKKKM